MDVKVLSFLVLSSLQGVYTKNYDNPSFQEVFLAALSSCKYNGYDKGCCTEGECAALSGTCYCDDKCMEREGGCCADIEEIGCLSSITEMQCNTFTIRNGDVTITINSDEDRVANISCNEMYYLDGPKYITCQNGLWVGKRPTCEPHTNCSMFPKDQSGCCSGGPDKCHAQPVPREKYFCYCDFGCFAEGTCCDDVTGYGCQRPTDCFSANFTDGCCTKTKTTPNCRVAGGNCSCHQDCYNGVGNDKCCPDIYTIGCKCQTASLSLLDAIDKIKMAANYWRQYYYLKKERERKLERYRKMLLLSTYN